MPRSPTPTAALRGTRKASSKRDLEYEEYEEHQKTLRRARNQRYQQKMSLYARPFTAICGGFTDLCSSAYAYKPPRSKASPPAQGSDASRRLGPLVNWPRLSLRWQTCAQVRTSLRAAA